MVAKGRNGDLWDISAPPLRRTGTSLGLRQAAFARLCSGCPATTHTSAIGHFNTAEGGLGRALLDFVANPR